MHPSPAAGEVPLVLDTSSVNGLHGGMGQLVLGPPFAGKRSDGDVATLSNVSSLGHDQGRVIPPFPTAFSPTYDHGVHGPQLSQVPHTDTSQRSLKRLSVFGNPHRIPIALIPTTATPTRKSLLSF
jgi:hypothetical protein